MTDRPAGTPTVVAIVLTFDAPVELERCVLAIDAQRPRPDRLVIVDNDSAEPAADCIGRLAITTPYEVIRMSSNTGPAGGHAAGLSRLLELDHDVAWVMDDDCEPQADSLRLLLDASSSTGPTVDPIYPTWFNTALGHATEYPAWCGFLIRRATVAAVGVPRAEFFWWMEDTEYLHWRIREAGYEPLRVSDAVVLHHQDRRVGPKPSWKYYYEVRNSVYFRLRVQRGRGRRYHRLARALAGAVKGALSGPETVTKLILIGRGLVDGLTARLGPRPGLPPRRGTP